MIETLAVIGLFPAKEILLIPALIAGSYFVDRQLFKQAGILLFATMLISPLLKKIATSFGVGYDFPSGHMFLATTFWGFLLHNLKAIWFRMMVVAALLMQAWSLTYFNYHSYFDVFGGFVFAILLITIYISANARIYNKKYINLFVVVFSTSLFCYFHTAKPYLLLPYFCLISLSIADLIRGNRIDTKARTLSFYCASLIFVMALVCGYVVFPNLSYIFATVLCLWSLSGLDSVLTRFVKY